MEADKVSKKAAIPKKKKLKTFKENAPFLVMIFPAVLVVFLFNYLPIYGVLIAFQDFMPGDKILSDTTIWVGFENFKRFFSDPMFWPLMKKERGRRNSSRRSSRRRISSLWSSWSVC